MYNDYYYSWRGFSQEPEFEDPGGRSALRKETDSNPRNLPCPNCNKPNKLTPADTELGYQCDTCAEALEETGGY